MNTENSEFIDEYKEIKTKLGHSPSYKELFEISSFKPLDLQKLYGANYFNRLVEEAGGTPRKFARERASDDDLLISWGNMVRKLGRIPTVSDWRHYNFRPGIKAYRYHFGKLADVPVRFRIFAKDNPEWSDVSDLLVGEVENEISNGKVDLVGNSNTSKYLNFVPAILRDFEDLSKSEDKTKSLIFEDKVNIAYQLLGFDVERLGQGSGRNPDGIAYAIMDHFAIIYDAKLRKDGYSFDDDDRVINEYIEKHKDKIRKRGCERIYYQIVSSKFVSEPKQALKNVFNQNSVVVTFLTTHNFVRILAKKIEYPNNFDLKEFERVLLTEQGDIKTSKVESLLSKFDKHI